MQYTGTITRIQRDHAAITLIIQSAIGLRAIELDPALWEQVSADFGLSLPDDLIGWAVEYDPEHGDLEITAPGDDE